ncbi:MAG TPA: PAS domain S-box protein [Candidatus Acidoferrales bacterium]|nr:PAS domain S-box protein [Candidatus Acidoferrales bacterium]
MSAGASAHSTQKEPSSTAGKQQGTPAHSVEFYPDEEYLLRSLSSYIGGALGAGDAAMVIATRAHRDGLESRLNARGLNLATARERGRYFPLDAEKLLEGLLIDGHPSGEVLERVLQDVLSATGKETDGGQAPRLVAFGEMVALLSARGWNDAALELEKIWNELTRKYQFDLRCAYPLNGFYRESDHEFFVKVCAEHSELSPSELRLAPDELTERLKTIAVLQERVRTLESENALRLSEEKFRLLVSSVRDYAIFILDPEGNVISWNAGAERIKGYTAAEILGRNFANFYPPEAQAAKKPAGELKIAASEGRFEEEGWRVRKDGTQFWANVVITALRDAKGQLIGFAKVTRDVTDRAMAAKRLQESEKSLRRLSAQLLKIQDEERKRLGRELHDSVGQYLAALKMNLDAMRLTASQKELGRPQGINESVDLLDQCIREVRTISYLLYPPMLEELGLKSAVPWYLEGFSKRSGIETSFQIEPPTMERFSRDVELAIFRVLQESLTNVHRHSGSTTASIRLETKNGDVILEVRDSGKGVPKAVLENATNAIGTHGVGFRGMKERLIQLGGKLEIESGDEGTTVRATVPKLGETD